MPHIKKLYQVLTNRYIFQLIFVVCSDVVLFHHCPSLMRWFGPKKHDHPNSVVFVHCCIYNHINFWFIVLNRHFLIKFFTFIILVPFIAYYSVWVLRCWKTYIDLWLLTLHHLVSGWELSHKQDHYYLILIPSSVARRTINNLLFLPFSCVLVPVKLFNSL